MYHDGLLNTGELEAFRDLQDFIWVTRGSIFDLIILPDFGGLFSCILAFFFFFFPFNTPFHDMLTISRETSILLNDEYLKYADTITTIQKRLQNDIQLLGLEPSELKKALAYSKDRGEEKALRDFF